MAHSISCYRCGESLASLSLPLSRRDQCPSCFADMHVCRMCTQFDPTVARQCREDDADDVTDKQALNFCDYFEPSPSAFDPSRKKASDEAAGELDRLFAAGAGDEPEADASPADKLFK